MKLPPTCCAMSESLGKASFIIPDNSLGMIQTNEIKLVRVDWDKNLEFYFQTWSSISEDRTGPEPNKINNHGRTINNHWSVNPFMDQDLIFNADLSLGPCCNSPLNSIIFKSLNSILKSFPKLRINITSYFYKELIS